MKPSIASPISILRRSVQLFFSKQAFPLYLVILAIPELLYTILSQVIKSQQRYISTMLFSTPPAFISLLLVAIALLIIGTWYDVILYRIHMSIAESNRLPLPVYVTEARKRMLHFLVTRIAVVFTVLLGALFFVIPGVLFYFWFWFAPLIAALESHGVDPLKTSKLLVAKSFWPIVGRILIFSLLYELPLVVFRRLNPLLGAGWSLMRPFFGLATVMLYLEVKRFYLDSLASVGMPQINPGQQVPPGSLPPSAGV